MPPPTIPKYFTILMTEMRDAIIFVGFWRPQCPPPPLTPQYLTILMTERRRALSFVGFWRPPPSPDATILINDLNGRERGWGANIL